MAADNSLPRNCPTGFMSAKIISAHELERQSATGSVKIFDCRFALNDPDAGRAAYEGSHIPGAVYVDLEKDLSGPVKSGTGRHPLPGFAVWRETLLRLHIDANSPVVLYDGGPGVFAARFWWMLGWAGIPDVRLLDGGFEEWRAQGLPLETEEHFLDSGAVSGDTVSQVESVGYVNADYLMTRLNSSDPLVVDDRDPERFCGRNVPLDKKPGCKSGHRHFALNLSKGKFKTPESLREEFGAP